MTTSRRVTTGGDASENGHMDDRRALDQSMYEGDAVPPSTSVEKFAALPASVASASGTASLSEYREMRIVTTERSSHEWRSAT